MKFFKGCKDNVHKYEPRYDSKLPAGFSMTGMKAQGDVASFVEAMKDRIYLFDVCIRCGKKIKREE